MDVLLSNLDWLLQLAVSKLFINNFNLFYYNNLHNSRPLSYPLRPLPESNGYKGKIKSWGMITGETKGGRLVLGNFGELFKICCITSYVG